MTIQDDVNLIDSKLDNLTVAVDGNTDRLDLMANNNTILDSYVVVERANQNYLDVQAKIGVKVSTTIHGTAIANYPCGLIIKPGLFAVVSYYRTLNSYTTEYSVDKVYSVYQNPTAANTGIGYSFGADIAADGKFAIASYARHIVRVYNADGTLLSTIGTPASAGHVTDNKLYNPKRCWFLDNGNLLVLSYRGRGDQGTNDGHLSEYTLSGTFVSSWLKFTGSGQSAVGTDICYRIMDGDWDKEDPNILWISEYGRNRILKFNVASKLIDDIIYPPSGTTFAQPWGVASLTDGNIAVASISDAAIHIIDVNTKELIQSINPSVVGASTGFRDLAEFEPGYLAFSDWNTRGIYIVPIEQTVDVDYDITPVDAAFTPIADLQYAGFDPSTGVLSQPINCIDATPEKIIVPYTTPAI